jgi:hypothetical protein
VIVDDLSQINYNEDLKSEIIDALFDNKIAGVTPVRIYKIALKNHKIGSDESIRMFKMLTAFGPHELFTTQAVKHLIQYHYD